MNYVDPTGHMSVREAWDSFIQGAGQVFDADTWENSWNVANTNLPTGAEIFANEVKEIGNATILPDPNSDFDCAMIMLPVAGEVGIVGRKVGSKAVGKLKEWHHIATNKSKVFDFSNHPAFKETGINVSKDIDNLVELANHRGRHTNAYHQEVWDRLNSVYNRYGEKNELEGAVRSELSAMKQELLDGPLTRMESKYQGVLK